MVLFYHGKESQYSDKEPLFYIIELFIYHIIAMILTSGKRLHNYGKSPFNRKTHYFYGAFRQFSVAM